MATIHKGYPAELVAMVAETYAAGHTQCEIAQQCGLTQKVIWNVMRKHGITARAAAPRDQRGENNNNWKGDQVAYARAHIRVIELRGQPMKCEECGTDDPSKGYHWASLTKNYTDPWDYKRMCRSCHFKFDKVHFNLGAYAQKKQGGSA